ncbi:SfnB family sulfur acquisition oxidoreductase [Acidovorax sp. NCPPB 4044]|uniref:SfnB family sulfur acquisition oxidoreductase n=1 Tax=Acidovorax sp. NCPPB 4044 TaxID=2940490 RepID=UPI0023034B6B|nr:SfnB family sulfur acquisition oxidoreductase [Acidovorax sp. NCPPB 4044]MDA8521685.1 SfnB family sulfur acquisition oxidoreductase [Acidovorax sp. NCPPB 4044]
MTANSPQEQHSLHQAHAALPLPPPPARRPPVLATPEAALAAARALADAWAPQALARDRERRLPWAEIEDYSASGLWGITVPPAHGGPGADAWTLARAIATVSAADGSLGHIPQNHFYALEVLRVGGSAAQQRFFYGRVLEGERFGNALSETGHRDYRRRTRLERAGGGWVLEGRKFYCTGALFAHWIPTQAMQQRDDGSEASVIVFVPRGAPGVAVEDDWDGMGQRVTGSGSVRLEGVRVEPEWIVPFQASFDRPTPIGPFAQIMHAAIDLGIGEGALQATLPFLRTRARPWIDAQVERATDDPLTLHAVGDVDVRLHAARALLRRAARFVDAAQQAPGEDTVAAASVAVAEARALAHRAGLLAANKLLELGGTSATTAEHGFDRYWRNVRTHTLHDPVRWKYHAVGNYVLNGTRPPRHGAL